MRRRVGIALLVVGACLLPVLALAATVAQVLIEGNSRVDEEAIRIHVQSHQGTPYDSATVDSDVRAIYGMGFFENVEVERRPSAEGIVLVFRVRERPLVVDVKIEGNKKVHTEDLETALKVRPRTILDSEKLRRGVLDAKKVYEEKGYLDATITPKMAPSETPNEITLTYTIDEGQLIRIQHIEFEGNQAFSDSKLKRIITTKEEWFLSSFTGAGVLNKETLKTDTERVTAWYYDNGYINVRVDEPEVERKPDGLYVTIKIAEGDVFAVGKIGFAGDVRNDLDLQKDLDLNTGETFRTSKLRQDILKLTDKYGDVGYAFVNIEPETDVDPDKKTVDVTYRIDEGPDVTIDKIIITGNTKTRDKVVRRELKVEEQQRFSGTKLKKSRDALNRLGFFQEVNLTTQRGRSEEKLNLQVDVKEGQTGALTAGAGFSSADNLLFNARVSENNLFGLGYRAVLNADFGSIRQNFIGSFTDPYFMDIPLQATVDGFRWRLDYTDFTRSGTGGSVRLLYPLTEFGYDRFAGRFSLEEVRVGAEYRLEDADISNLNRRSPPAVVAEEGHTLISAIRPILSRNTLNSLFDPTRGSTEELSVEYAGLGVSTEYVKVDVRGRAYWPIYKSPSWGTTVFSIGGAFGFGRGDRGDSGHELPLIERYFPGGINSIRGFQTRTLGPRQSIFNAQGQVVQSDPIGGSLQLVVNNEIIFPIVEQLGLKGVVFFDAGNAWLYSDGYDLADLRYAAGAGLRWQSPMGPIRIELGYPLNKHRHEKASLVLFSFGAPL
ncbi:MAG TPA: outer membrane protein assembly factor BamA [Candidatus Binatia bacterium]|jgi:outer membrane protein insertion porin family